MIWPNKPTIFFTWNIMSKPVLIAIGTRPEGIKMAPVYFALKAAGIPTVLCSTFQHTSLLQEVFDVFGIEPDINLNLMRPNQDLFHITNSVLTGMKKIYSEIDPGLVLVHGDTTTTFSAALAAFYMKIPVGHVEAGLRTGDIYSPFPEEMNRKLVGTIATYNFAPTHQAIGNLLSEGVNRESIFYVGNTVKDSLRIMSGKIKSEITLDKELLFEVEKAKVEKKKIVLVTAHRRESFDGGIFNILSAIKKYAESFDDVQFFYPCHPNPNVVKVVEELDIKNCKNIFSCKPIAYPNLVYLLESCDVVVTDSGGIQEEASCLGKPIVVVREHTDRPEAIWAGLAKIVGTDKEKIEQALNQFLYGFDKRFVEDSQLYGDGYAANKIANIIQSKLDLNLSFDTTPKGATPSRRKKLRRAAQDAR
jgi:UDP-N-acetylglucosamine 2-epimerase (non-hydrolysing)